MDTPSPMVRTGRSRRDRLVFFGILALALLGLFGLFKSTDWHEIVAKLGEISLSQAAALLALSLVNYLLRAWRWHLFGAALGLKLSLASSFSHYFGGFAMSVTPGKIGELIRVRWLAAAADVPLIRAFPAALADRASDLAALAILLSGCLMLSVQITGAWAVAALALATAFVATHPVVLERAVGLAHRVSGRRFARLMVRLRISTRSLGLLADRGTLLPAIALGISGWAAEGYAFHLLLVWFGSDIGQASALAIFIFATLAGGLTGSPGGLGGAEAAMVALLAFRGVEIETAIAATVIIRVTTLWFAVGIGILTLPFAEGRRERGRE